jgi:isopentenyl-diphosphate delta-isomerase
MSAVQVVLVDAEDREIGRMEKQEAHVKGSLHRAFSIFVFNSEGEMLLQRRAPGKYHSGGLWSNTCCGHPRPGEGLEEAALRRLQEEMGFQCPLAHAFSFIYREEVGALVEHELDHVFIGTYDGAPAINPGEVSEWRAVPTASLVREVRDRPGDYTVWFRICLDRVGRHCGMEAQGSSLEHTSTLH